MIPKEDNTDWDVGVEVKGCLGVREINCVLNDGGERSLSAFTTTTAATECKLHTAWLARTGHGWSPKVSAKLGEPLVKLAAQGPS